MKPTNDLTMGMPDAPDAAPDDEMPGAPEQEPDADDAGMTPGELCVPLASLSEPDDKDEMTPPAEGDKGQANVEYTVTRVEGENAYITLDAVNGNKMGQAAEPGDDSEMAQLQSMAAQQPERY